MIRIGFTPELGLPLLLGGRAGLGVDRDVKVSKDPLHLKAAADRHLIDQDVGGFDVRVDDAAREIYREGLRCLR